MASGVGTATIAFGSTPTDEGAATATGGLLFTYDFDHYFQ